MSTVPSDLDFIRLLPRLAKQYAGRTALMYKSAPGASWTDIAWPELAHSAGQVSRALIGAGLEKGEVVAVFAPNCPEYYYINFGAYQAGVVTTPFFPSSSQAEVEFMLRDAGVRIIFVGNQQQYDVAFPLFATVPSLHKFVIINPEVKRHPTDSFSLYFDEFMRLGAPDASGRRAPEPAGETVIVPATAVITAVGERIEQGLYQATGCELDEKGRPVVSDSLETSVPHVFAAGDARRGPATVVKAIADAMTVTTAIAGTSFYAMGEKNVNPSYEAPLASRGTLEADVASLAHTRCLGCATVCETCCEVCPNRANVAIRVSGMRERQIVHMDGMCNECGNCAVFCPYSEGKPYRDKLTLFWSREDFDDSQNEGFLPVEGGMLVRLDGATAVYNVDDPACGLPEAVRAVILAVRDNYGYLLAR